MDAYLIVAALACVATWFLRGLHDERRARRASLERLIQGHRVDLAVETERALARRSAALEDANLAWSEARQPVVIDLSAFRHRRREHERGGAA